MALQIEELLALQELDTEIGKLQEERASLDHGEHVKRALAVRRARLENAELSLKGLEIEQRDDELRLKTLEEKKHGESRKLYEGRITNPKELVQLEEEIKSLERQRLRLDDGILKRLEELEARRKAVATAQASVDEAEKALRIITRRFEKESRRIDAGIAAIAPKREHLTKELGADVLRRYDDIRRRNHNLAAVRIENGACGGCRMKVGTALLRRMASGDQYVYCESCSRYLFPPLEGKAG